MVILGDDEGRRPRGRPRKDDAARRRPKLTVRLRPDVRAAIETAAAAHGRSLAEEIERRVEETVRQDASLGSPEARAIVNMLAAAFCLAGQRGADEDPRWVRSFDGYVAGMLAAMDVLLRELPATDPQAKRLAHEAIVSRLLTRLLESQTEAPAQPTKRRPAA